MLCPQSDNIGESGLERGSGLRPVQIAGGNFGTSSLRKSLSSTRPVSTRARMEPCTAPR